MLIISVNMRKKIKNNFKHGAIVKKILDTNVEPNVLKRFKKESAIKKFFNFFYKS